MIRSDVIRLVLEIHRRLQEIIEREGESFELIVDRQQWTNPRYGHQN